MSVEIVELSGPEHTELDAFLAERIYEFNAQATGIVDGRSFAASLKNAAGEIIAAVTGHTWGGTCQVTHLWVEGGERHGGLGTKLMRAAEEEARRRGCAQVLLSTHSFQAPAFYDRLGYTCRAVIQDYPKGHASFLYTKDLRTSGG